MAMLPIKHIAMTPDMFGGKPHIAGRRITVQNIVVLSQHHHWSVEEIANELELTPGQIHAALSYYHDHKEEIDHSIIEADTLAKKVGKPIEQLRQRTQNG